MSKVKDPIKKLFQYLLSGYSGRLGIACSASVLNKIADLMPPLMVGWIIDSVSGLPPKWVQLLPGFEQFETLILYLSVLIVIVFAIESFFEWVFQFSFLTLAQQVQHDLRLQAYDKLQKRELKYFENNRTGNLMAILNDDINQLERFLNGSFNEVIQLVTLVIFASFALFQTSASLAFVGMLPIPLIIWGSFLYQKKVTPLYASVRESVGEVSSRLENNISGIQVIKSFTAEAVEYERLKQASEKYKKANFKAINWSAIYVPVIRMLVAFSFAICMYIGASWVVSDTAAFTLGQLTFFAMMIQRLLWPITRLGRVFDEIARAKASINRIFNLIESESEIKNPIVSQETENQVLKGKVEFENVIFSYSNGQAVLNGIDLSIEAGNQIGIAGSTGSGKTSLIKLLLRFYDVSNGSIKIDGKDIRTISLNQLRRSIALVSQDVYIFHGTIAENIAYGLSGDNEREIIQAAKEAELDEFISSLPEKYNTIVGERGIKLSGGQRQRLSIARAILKNAPILILDEATSAVDTETERAIQKNLANLTRGKTALIVAHRLSTIRQADQIIVLSQGQIVEQGTHEGLLNSNGTYSDLWNVQIGELDY